MCPPSTPISIEVTPEAAFSRTSSALRAIDRKSTRLNSSHLVISYAVFCLKKKKHYMRRMSARRRTLHIRCQFSRLLRQPIRTHYIFPDLRSQQDQGIRLHRLKLAQSDKRS